MSAFWARRAKRKNGAHAAMYAGRGFSHVRLPVQAIVSWLLVFALVIGTNFPASQAARAAPAFPADFDQLSAALGEPVQSLLQSLCQHGDSGQPAAPSHDGGSHCKNDCCLCQAFGHAGPLLPQQIASRLAPSSLLQKLSWEASRSALQAPWLAEARPRAPPRLA